MLGFVVGVGWRGWGMWLRESVGVGEGGFLVVSVGVWIGMFWRLVMFLLLKLCLEVFLIWVG